jgi:23S rRNA pseudouridine1911/1915/1917 synthase
VPDPFVITAREDDIDQRADVVLGRRVPGLSRRVARALALAGRLRVDGRPAPPSHRVRPGERLELLPAAPVAAPPALVVLAVTARLVYVDKPPGVHTHRLRPDDPPALADAVVAAFPECAAAGEDPREGGAVHRLDRGTSGVVAFARTSDVHRAARAAFAGGDVAKRYLSLVTCPEGLVWPPPASPWRARLGDHLLVTAPLGPGAGRDRVAVRPDGRPARTRLAAPRASGPGRARCELHLDTGRRHQARVHLAWLGLPIVGDLVYGGAPADRMYLHAAALDLRAVDPREAPVAAPAPPGF